MAHHICVHYLQPCPPQNQSYVLYFLYYCQMSSFLYISFNPRFQKKKKYNPSPQRSLYSTLKYIIMKIQFPHYFPTNRGTMVSNLQHSLQVCSMFQCLLPTFTLRLKLLNHCLLWSVFALNFHLSLCSFTFIYPYSNCSFIYAYFS